MSKTNQNAQYKMQSKLYVEFSEDHENVKLEL